MLVNIAMPELYINPLPLTVKHAHLELGLHIIPLFAIFVQMGQFLHQVALQLIHA